LSFFTNNFNSVLNLIFYQYFYQYNQHKNDRSQLIMKHRIKKIFNLLKNYKNQIRLLRLGTIAFVAIVIVTIANWKFCNNRTTGHHNP